MGGYRNGFELLITGLDIEAKAKVFTDAFFNNVGGEEQFDDVAVQLIRNDKENPNTNEEAFARLRVTVKSQDQKLVGRLFGAKVVEIGLGNIPGFTMSTGPGAGDSFLCHWPALIDSKHVVEHVHVNGQVIDVKPSNQLGLPPVNHKVVAASVATAPGGKTVSIPFGRLYGTRSGDKGGCANLGVWATSDESYAFLYAYLTVEKFKELLQDTAEFEVIRYEMPNICSLNFYIKGILGEGVAASVRIDGQAKSLGEYLRAKTIEVPSVLAQHLI